MMPNRFLSIMGRHSGSVGSRSKPVALLAALLVVAGCAKNSEEATQRNVWVEDGPPTSCISTNQIRSIRIIDDRTINFEVTGRRIYRNDLPFRCSGLSFNQSIRHNSRTSQLCNLNTVSPRGMGRSASGPSCQLGRFQPLKRTTVPVAPLPQ